MDQFINDVCKISRKFQTPSRISTMNFYNCSPTELLPFPLKKEEKNRNEKEKDSFSILLKNGEVSVLIQNLFSFLKHLIFTFNSHNYCKTERKMNTHHPSLLT